MERMLAEAHTKLENLGFRQAKIEREYDDIERTVKEISALGDQTLPAEQHFSTHERVSITAELASKEDERFQ